MSKRNRHGVNIPGELLDQIRDSERYEDDDRFKAKKRKIGRKDKRRQEREEKKKQKQLKPQQNILKINQQQLRFPKQQHRKLPQKSIQSKKSSIAKSSKDSSKSTKKHVSFSSHDEVKNISANENDDSDSFTDGYEDYFFGGEEEEAAVMAQILQSKGKKSISSSSGDLKIVKEDDLEDDEASDLGSDDDQGISTEEDWNDQEITAEADEQLDEEQEAVMAQLMALKGVKNPSHSQFRIVKVDNLEDDEVSDLDAEEESNSDEDDRCVDDDEDQKAVMAKLMALKGNKRSFTNDFKIVKEEELEDDEISDLGSDSEDPESEDISSTEELDDDDDDNDSNDEHAAMAKLMAVKEKKGGKSSSQIKIVKEADLENDEASDLDDGEDEERIKEPKSKTDKTKEKKDKKDKKRKQEPYEKYERKLSSHDRGLLKKDDEDIVYYAKKLGMKRGKALSKQGDDDVIGGLLDGLDLDFDDDLLNSTEDEEEQETLTKKQKRTSKRNESEDEDDFGSSDFDDDQELDEDDKALLREMGELEGSDNSGDEYDTDSDDSPRAKENPYVAPVAQGDQSEQVPGSRYIPPALRRKMALEGKSEESEEVIKLTSRSIKGPLNKLSEPNLVVVVNDLNQLYNENPRQVVNEAIIKTIMQSVLVPGPLLDSFLILYSSVIVSIYRLQGVDFGAFAIQKFVEKLNEYFNKSKSEAKGKEPMNLVALLGFCYSLNLTSSKLIYDIIANKLIKETNELKTDILLRLVKVAGPKLRSDDPASLKEIIIGLNKSLSENEKKGISTSSRSKFLVDTITNLKNNKLKSIENENSSQMLIRIKKQLSRVNSSRISDPIKVSLDDIESIEERGKWWLVGSAWKGLNNANKHNYQNDNSEADYEVNDEVISDILDTAEPNWLELAKQQRMNTDIRRAIFISIMSANDYMDSFVKLEKLRLKRSQEREIPRILMHCAAIETVFNPYYGVLAKKLCEEHSMRKTFQFNLWDLLKEFEGDDDENKDLMNTDLNEDENKLKKILNLGRLFGFLIAEASLPLNIIRAINFLTASSDTKLFIEILLITFLDTVAKNSEEKSFGSGLNTKSKLKDMKFNDKMMLERLAKCREQALLLKGIQFFLTDKVRDSNLIKGRKQSARVNWGIDSMCDIIDNILEQN